MLTDLEKYTEAATHFLKRVASELNTPNDLQHALRVIQPVFHVLRDTISTEDSEEFISLLPYQIADIYTENWDKSKERLSFGTSEDFYNVIREHSDTVPLDFFNNTETRQAIQAVFRALREPLPGHVFEYIKSRLPKPVYASV